MVQSIDLPLKASDEAIVNFLLKVVFAPKKGPQLSQRACLQHDVYGACKLISWIMQKDRRSPRSLTVACNLVYGNTIVLSQQVARLLLDATRAREIVAFTSYLAEEEERKRRTREQMGIGLDDDSTTPKKKRRSKAADVDDYLLVPSTPINMALRQNITMADALATPRDDNILIEDDLAPPTEEQYELLYGMLNSDNPNNSIDVTFMDRFSSSNNRREDVHNETLDFRRTRMDDFEFERQTNEVIRTQQETPMKNNYTMPQDDEIFEPHAALADILRYGRLPLLEQGENVRSMEQEMDDARHRGIHAEFGTPMHRFEVPHIPSHISLDDDVIIPPISVTPRAPHVSRKLAQATFNISNATDNTSLDQNKFRISLKEMNNMMEDYSSLHYDNASSLRMKLKKPMPLAELLGTVPYFMRKHCNDVLGEQFPTRSIRFDPSIKPNVSVSDDKESDEEEEETLRIPAAPLRHNFDDLEPINLSQLKFMETPLREHSPISSPRRPQYEFDDVMLEQPRHEEPLMDNPISPLKYQDDQLLDDPFNCARTFGSVFTGSNAEDKSSTTIREELLSECEKMSPYSFQLDYMMEVDRTSRREAARTFYVALELLKERSIKATQVTPYGPIDLIIAGNDLDDLEDLAMEIDDGDF